MSAIQEWYRAHLAYKKAGETAMAAFRRAVKVGDEVRWTHGDHVQRGEVIWTDTWGYAHARIKVRAHKSGKEYFLHASRILDAMRAR